MELQNPVAVYGPKTLAEGQALAEALTSAGIPAQVIMEEVVVAQDDAERAVAALKAYEQSLIAQQPQTFITAVCEECGESSTFEGALGNTVQDCPHCGKFMDVAVHSDDIDYGDPEEEAPSHEEEE